MKVLLYSLNYAPELIGIGKYNAELSNWLSMHGHTVQVVCAPPYYPYWKVQSGYSSRVYSTETLGKVTVSRCPIWVPRDPKGIQRILHLLSFAISSLPILLLIAFRWKPDIILTLEPPLFCLPNAVMASRLAKSNLWLHIQDYELDAAFHLGFIPSFKIIKYFAYGLERFLLKQTDVISTISYEMMQVLHDKGVRVKNKMLLPNWVETQVIAPLDRESPYRKELGIKPEQIVCMYSGNLGEKQGLSIIIDAARHLINNDNIVFVISGEGPSRQNLLEDSRDLQSIKFLNLQSAERFNDLLNMADIHLLPQLANSKGLFFPSKLKAMFSSGRPVIASVNLNSDIAKVVSGCGLVIPPEDSLLLSKAILYLAEDSQQRKRLGRDARNHAVTNWSKDKILSNINYKLSEIMQKAPRGRVKQKVSENS